MDAPMTCKRRQLSYVLFRSRLAQLIVCLLLVLVITHLVVHYYVSSISGDGLQGHKSRSQLEHSDDLDNLMSSDLKGQIEELRQIRASVNNDLRDLESRRLNIQLEISDYKSKAESLQTQLEKLEKAIYLANLNLDQLKMEEHDITNVFRPILKAPFQVLIDTETSNTIIAPSSSRSCKMHTCFDYSRCSLVSGFHVYVYTLDLHFNDDYLNDFVKSTFSHEAFSGSAYLTKNPSEACVYIVVLGDTVSEMNANKLQSLIFSLSYWHGDGRNHILLNLARNSANTDMFQSVNTGRAMIVQSSFIETIFRCKFDILVPPNFGSNSKPVWVELPPLNPVRRQYMLSFIGQFTPEIKTVASKGSNEVKNDPDNDLVLGRKLHGAIDMNILTEEETATSKMMDLERRIVENLKLMQTGSKEILYFSFFCDKQEGVGINGEWLLCGPESHRTQILRSSTFSIIIAPANFTIVSTTVFQTRLYESLKHGAIPVILGDYAELPFSEILDWRKTAIVVPKSRITELYFLLSTLVDVDVMEFKRNGRIFFETYFATTKSIIFTILAVVRTRLQIPAEPVQEVPSPNSVTNFIPVSEHIGVDLEEETDEVLGPVEPPFPCVKYKHNFTADVFWDIFNNPGDPFHSYPYTPFEKVLPSDSKFNGSGFGFRPVNKGEGGSGKEFSEAIGGNHPREQFTMVLLTYERSDVLIKAITRLKGLPYLNKVIVVWNNPAPPSENLGWPEIGVPVIVLKMSKNSLNNRFLPFEAIETEAILSIDDDSHLRHDEIVFGFRVWREERDRIVGFPGRYHAWDAVHHSWHYNSNYTCEMSMVLTGAAFFHKYYAYLYSYTMPQAIRDKVDEYMNCEDIAMNFLVSHVTRKPPVKVTSRWTFRCPGCPQQLALDTSHFDERHKCINFFVEVYGYMPLLYTQYRVDSILFKTRISHDKQKCFKFI